jgi:hypothetical protein
MNFADLELSLYRRSEERYGVELRYTQPGSDADIRLAGQEIVVNLDFDRLRQSELEPLEYGQLLTELLFASPALRSSFAQARAASGSLDIPMRLRFFVSPNAPELQTLRWETLRDPEEDRPLLSDERLLFSRYLAAGDWRPIKLRPKTDLAALIAVAAPDDLGDYDLALIDAPAEEGRALQALGGLRTTSLATPGSATLDAIVDKLRGGVDIFYLVCHGAMIEGEPWLWLEDQDNKVARVAASDLAQRVRELDQRPRLIVLASCESAGNGTGDALAAFGPRLAEAGVPAVIAMQGKISMKTVETFTPAFFKELMRDGQIDRALAVARGVVRERDDAWMPALFMRLKSGRIWYVPGFGDDKQSFEKWPTIVRSLKRGQCTPIIGSYSAEAVLGGLHEVAGHWSEIYGYPLAAHQREALHEVAQYLSVNQAPQFPREEIIESLRAVMAKRFADDLAEGAADADIYDLMAVAGEIIRERNEADLFKLLAEQPLPIYVTTGYHSLLSEALRAAGKDPMVEFCRWNEDIEKIPSIYDDEPKYLPTPERPLVFHLYGILAEPDSLVITEDDYFDYLIRVSRDVELIPLPVREALNDTALLFLGFRVDDWDFRVLFRSLMQQEGRGRRRKYAHIAGQVALDEDNFMIPERARRYFESYFQNSDISLFWGSVEDFARELNTQLKAAVEEPKAAPERASLRRR